MAHARLKPVPWTQQVLDITKGYGCSLTGETTQKAGCAPETINHDHQVAGAMLLKKFTEVICTRYPHVFLLFPDSNHASVGVCVWGGLLKTKIFKRVKI